MTRHERFLNVLSIIHLPSNYKTQKFIIFTRRMAHERLVISKGTKKNTHSFAHVRTCIHISLVNIILTFPFTRKKKMCPSQYDVFLYYLIVKFMNVINLEF